ncbi:MAG: hypothetical protein KGJ14_10230, partial [Nitrospirota bacterium]|nr:hypothetical protein [Nitrospirota bacterium]
MRKDQLIEETQEDIEPAEALDVETDDPEASTMLGAIEREPSEGEQAEGPVVKGPAGRSEDQSMALESLYVRSFGERALLNRQEEIALAKGLDQGTRGIRVALRETMVFAGRMRKSDKR